MTKAEKDLEEMKCFVTSAGCMTIEHIATAIRQARLALTPTEVRTSMTRVKHYVDIFIEDFKVNFPKGKGKSDGCMEGHNNG